MSRTAVVLFNLGGPDGPGAVQPFLFNLFNDPAIIGLPWIARWPLAKLISSRRAPVAREIYANLGGGSPLLANTEIQARALEAKLAEAGGDWGVFISMRYWHPFSREVARKVKAWQPERIVLLPLYPQFSTTTSASSLGDWAKAAKSCGLDQTPTSVCCYPSEPGFLKAVAQRTARVLEDLPKGSNPRVLFSAHGLPKKIVDAGDPYQWQVEQSVAGVVRCLAEMNQAWTNLDAVVCYQSRVGPLEWIGPATEAEVERAGAEGKPLVVVPIAFVSEHSETLVELDIEYAELAREKGVPLYRRVPTVDDEPAFIEGLARLVRQALGGERRLCSERGGRLCPATWKRCPQDEAA